MRCSRRLTVCATGMMSPSRTVSQHFADGATILGRTGAEPACRTQQVRCWRLKSENAVGDVVKVLIVGWLLKRVLPVLIVVGVLIALYLNS